MLLQPILQIHVLHPTGGQDLFPLPIHPRYHRIILVDVQRHVAAGTCTCFIFHATLSLGLLLGRGFSGRELHTPIRARGPDENPPGDQVTPRAEILTLSHRQRRSAQMLRAPDGIPGTTSPSGYHPPRPNPSYILVTQRAADLGYAPRYFGFFLAFGFSRFRRRVHAPTPLDQAR